MLKSVDCFSVQYTLVLHDGTAPCPGTGGRSGGMVMGKSSVRERIVQACMELLNTTSLEALRTQDLIDLSEREIVFILQSTQMLAVIL